MIGTDSIGFQAAHFGSKGVVRGDTGPLAGSFDLSDPSCRPASAARSWLKSSTVSLTRLKDGMPLTVPALLMGSSWLVRGSRRDPGRGCAPRNPLSAC